MCRFVLLLCHIMCTSVPKNNRNQHFAVETPGIAGTFRLDMPASEKDQVQDSPKELLKKSGIDASKTEDPITNASRVAPRNAFEVQE